MKISHSIQLCVSKIVQKQQFVKDIFISIFNQGGKVLLVGGAVRDLLLDKEVKDLDFEVYGLSLIQLQEILQLYGIVSFIGKSFGVLRLHGIDIDWSLPRKDSSGRHPIVAYDPFMSYEQAFIRRDLTINAMGIDMQTFDLIDVCGGLHDLQHKILRSPNVDFFIQDPLRLLRVMQFVGRFEMLVDDQLSQVCSTMDMSKVSQERIEQEFTKLFLQSNRPALGLQWLSSIGKFHEFLPCVKINENLLTMINAASQQNYRSSQEKLAVVWAVMMSDFFINLQKNKIEFIQITRQQKQIIIDCMKKISRDQQLIDQIADLVSYGKLIDVSLTDVQLKWLAVWLAPYISIRLLLQFAALQKDKINIDKLLQRSELLGIIDAHLEPLLQGKDFLEVAQGVALGALVKKAYEIQLDQGVVDRKILKSLVLAN